MMKFTSKLAAAVLAIGLSFGALPRTAEAAPINTIDATAGITLTVTKPGVSINVGTTFNYVASSVTVADNDLEPYLGTSLGSGSITAQQGGAVSFTADWGSFIGSVISVSATGLESGRNVTFIALGTFTPDGDLVPEFGAGAMSLTFSATQNGANAVVQAGFTIASPPTVTVPEPVSLSLLGAGLLALGVVRRTRRRDQRLDA